MNNTKNAPKLRFPEFNEDWEWCKLSEVVEVNPKSTLPEVFEYVDLESVVGTEMISHRTEYKNSAPSRAQRLAKKDDIFYQTVRPYQKNNYLFSLQENDKKFVFSTGYAQLRPKIDSYFLFSNIQEDTFVRKVLDKCTGTSYPAINASDLADIEIFISKSPTEQTTIGSFFRQIDELITLHQNKLDHTKTLKQGLLQKMFPKNGETVPEIRFDGFTDDWERCKLEDIAKMYSGGTPSISNKAYYGGKIPFIRSGEIYSDKTELFLSQEGLNKSSAKMVNKGDILYALYGATSGEVSRSLINGAINQAILAIIPNENYESEFISQFLAGQKDKIVSTYLQGGQGNLSGEIVKNLILTTPTNKEEQTTIGNFFRQIDELITLHQRKYFLPYS